MKKIHALIMVVCLVSGCAEDFVTVEPKATLFSSEYFSNADELEEALISTYDVLGHQKGIGLAWAPPMLMAETMSDDALGGGQDPSDGALQNEFNTFNLSTNNDKLRSLWKKNYFGIARANFVIENAQPLLEGSSASRVEAMIAEALFLRAYFHFELVRFFENVPILTFVPKTLGEANVPQAEPSVAYDQIATDLVEAMDGLSETIGTVRASKWAAKSLLARVYLFKKGVYGGTMEANGTTIDDAFVLAQLEDVISNSGHDLLNNYDSIFRKSAEFSIESVFEIAYEPAPIGGDWGSEQYVEGNLAAQMMGPRASGSTIYYRGWSFGIISHKLYLAMQGDPRLDATILTQATILSESGASLNTGAFQHTGYYNNKYTTREENRGDQGGTLELHNTSNQRVIRFSDVLLMAAELSQNATYLNRVRARVGLNPIAYSEEAIFNERRMELSGEGNRYYDLMRRGVNTLNQELNVSGMIGPNYTGEDNVYEVSVDMSQRRGFLPIPQTEIDLSNNLLVQNDGY